MSKIKKRKCNPIKDYRHYTDYILHLKLHLLNGKQLCFYLRFFEPIHSLVYGIYLNLNLPKM